MEKINFIILTFDSIMMQINKEQDRTVLKGEDNYFEGENYDDDLIFNSTYYQNNMLDCMHICNVFLEKGNCVKTTNQNEHDDEATFLVWWQTIQFIYLGKCISARNYLLKKKILYVLRKLMVVTKFTKSGNKRMGMNILS